MSQHDMVIDNQGFAATRADFNAALAALVTNSSGATEPATTYAFQWWADTTAGILKQRNAANSGWIDILNLTTGLPFAAASQAEMEAGTETALRAMSPLRVAQAIAALGNTKPVPVRQTVLSGPVDTNGFSAFGGSTGGTTVTASGTLVATASNGFGASGQIDRVGSITNPSWTGLSTTGTMYLYLDIAANGTCTTGSTTLNRVEQWGGTYSAISNQFTFNIQEMVGKVGNGSVATQTYRVFVGEVTVTGGLVTAITWYALQGRYTGAWTATLPGTSTKISANHLIGSIPGVARLAALCTTANAGFAVGDILSALSTTENGGPYGFPILPRVTTKVISAATGDRGAIQVIPEGGGSSVILTSASWSYRFEASRGW